MKLYLFLLVFFILSFSKENKSVNDFDSQLSQIVYSFKANIMDKDKCTNLKRNADDLSYEIQETIDDDQNSEYEKNKLVQLKREVNAIEEFIGSVGNCGNNSFVKMDLIYLANSRINSSIATVVKDKFCADVISISLNGYVATLVSNDSYNNYTISYSWKLTNTINSGNGIMGLPSKSIRHIYDNRSKPASKRITIISLSCKDIK